MNKLTKWFLRRSLTYVLSMQCPPRVPRTGDAGAAMNCFVTRIDSKDGPDLVLESIDGVRISCLSWDGRSFSQPKTISLDEVDLSQLRIFHNYGLSEVAYSSLTDFVIGRMTRFPYLKIRLFTWLLKLNQYLFNKRKLIAKQRMDLLQLLITRHLDGEASFSPIDLMTDIYSIHWVDHPGYEQAVRKLEYYIESLVASGEVERAGHNYRVTPKAIATIENNEELERRHAAAVRTQRNMIWLTAALAFFAAIQAGIIKLPVLLDLSK